MNVKNFSGNMKAILISVIALFGVRLLAQAAQAEPLMLPAISAPITLDGALDEPAWDQAVAIDQFHHRKKMPAPAKTVVRVLADSQFLYVGWRCEDKKTATLKGDVAWPNGPCWNDDAVELFIDPGHAFPSMVQIIVTCKGAIFQKGYGCLYERCGQDFGAAAKSFVGEDFWSVETRIPLDRIGLSLPAFRKGEASRFTMNFARDLRNPAYAKQQGERLDFSVAPMGYFDRKGFLPFLFAGSAPSLAVSGDAKEHMVNSLAATLAFANNSPNDYALAYRWGKTLQPAAAARTPLAIKAGEVRSLNLPVVDLTPGDTPYRLELFDHGQRLFVRDIVFTLDPAIEIAPTFPCRSADGGEKEFRLIPAPHLLATGKPYTLEAVVKDGFSKPLLKKQFPLVTSEVRVSVTDLFPTLADGRYTLSATLYDGDQAVAASQCVFYKGVTSLSAADPANIIKNWGFEETCAARPKSWRDLDPQSPDTLFPAGWHLWKLADWIAWGDLNKYPRSIYEGRRSLILKGLPRGPQQQLHWGGEKFKVNLNSTYTLSIAARGKGTICCCYYLATSEGKWIKRFFYTRDITLTDDWVEYKFDPVNFNANTETSWDDTPLGPNNQPSTASLVLWVRDDGLAFIDNVILVEHQN